MSYTIVSISTIQLLCTCKNHVPTTSHGAMRLKNKQTCIFKLVKYLEELETLWEVDKGAYLPCDHGILNSYECRILTTLGIFDRFRNSSMDDACRRQLSHRRISTFQVKCNRTYPISLKSQNHIHLFIVS